MQGLLIIVVCNLIMFLHAYVLFTFLLFSPFHNIVRHCHLLHIVESIADSSNKKNEEKKSSADLIESEKKNDKKDGTAEDLEERVCGMSIDKNNKDGENSFH